MNNRKIKSLKERIDTLSEKMMMHRHKANVGSEISKIYHYWKFRNMKFKVEKLEYKLKQLLTLKQSK